MATKSRPTAPKRAYQRLIEFDEVEPRVWRRLWVPDTLTLARLDRVIQIAMGWTNSHPHEFEVDGNRYGIPDVEGIYEMMTLDDRRHKVGAVLGDSVSGFRYTYDFGDNWRHTVTVEDRLLPDESFNTWPACIAGQNACPPGGRWRRGRLRRVRGGEPRRACRDVAVERRTLRPNRVRPQRDKRRTAQVALTHVRRPWGDFEQGWTRTRRRVATTRNRDRGLHRRGPLGQGKVPRPRVTHVMPGHVG